jgi:hypothetical protein
VQLEPHGALIFRLRQNEQAFEFTSAIYSNLSLYDHGLNIGLLTDPHGLCPPPGIPWFAAYPPIVPTPQLHQTLAKNTVPGIRY